MKTKMYFWNRIFHRWGKTKLRESSKTSTRKERKIRISRAATDTRKENGKAWRRADDNLEDNRTSHRCVMHEWHRANSIKGLQAPFTTRPGESRVGRSHRHTHMRPALAAHSGSRVCLPTYQSSRRSSTRKIITTRVCRQRCVARESW